MYFNIRSNKMGYEKIVLNIDDVCLVGKVKAVVKKIKFSKRVEIFVDKVQQIYKNEKPKLNNMSHRSYYRRPPLAHQEGLLAIVTTS